MPPSYFHPVSPINISGGSPDRFFLDNIPLDLRDSAFGLSLTHTGIVHLLFLIKESPGGAN